MDSKEITPGEYVRFDLAPCTGLCCIEPVIEEEIVGWANERVLIDAGLIPVRTLGKDEPVAWVPEAFSRERLPEPIAIKRKVLRWKAVQNGGKETHGK